jgi:hypothetical protein
MPNYRDARPGAGASGQEEFYSQNRTHKELVSAFREYLQSQNPTNRRQDRSNEELVSIRLFNRWGDSLPGSEKQRFFAHLITAWELVAYDRYEPGSMSERHAARTIAQAYEYDPVIKLTEAEAGALDVMTEAVGIPHRKLQREIPIPEKYADFDRWTSSPEYQERLTTAKARRIK